MFPTVPRFTVIYRVVLLGTPWESSGYAFFDDRQAADAFYEACNAGAGAVVVRPYHDSDRERVAYHQRFPSIIVTRNPNDLHDGT